MQDDCIILCRTSLWCKQWHQIINISRLSIYYSIINSFYNSVLGTRWIIVGYFHYYEKIYLKDRNNLFFQQWCSTNKTFEIIEINGMIKHFPCKDILNFVFIHFLCWRLIICLILTFDGILRKSMHLSFILFWHFPVYQKKLISRHINNKISIIGMHQSIEELS